MGVDSTYYLTHILPWLYAIVIGHWLYLIIVKVPTLRRKLRHRVTFIEEIDASGFFLPVDLRCPSCRTEIIDDAPRVREFGLCKYFCKSCGEFTHAVNDPEDQTPYPTEKTIESLKIK